MSTLRTDTLQTTDSAFSVLVADLAATSSGLPNTVDVTKGAALVGRNIQVIDSVAALKTLSKNSPSDYAQTTGYYTKGDGGGSLYYYDSADTTSADNGGSIIVAADGGRWKFVVKDSWSVKQFGAKGDGVTDDTVAIQAAINALPLRGGEVWLGGGQFNISQTINIGNGDGAGTVSTRNGVKLYGAGAGFAVSGPQVPTILQWVGASAAVPMINVRGRISDIHIKGMLLFCGGLCGGIASKAISGCEFEEITITNPRSNTQALAILGGAAPTGNYNIFNKFRKLNIALIAPNAAGLFMSGDYPSINDTWLTTFEQVRVDVVAGSTGSTAAWMLFVDNCSFNRCHFISSAEPSANALLLDATGNPGFLNDYPLGLAFYDCSITKVTVNEPGSSKIGPTYFYGHGVNDNEVLPDHPRLFGITANGEHFGHIAGARKRQNSDVNVQNTVASTNVFTSVVGNYTMGGGDSFRANNGGIHLKHHAHYINASGAAANVTVAVFLGGTQVASFPFTAIASNANAHAVTLDCYIQLSQNSVTAQSASATCIMGAAGTVTGTGATAAVVMNAANVLALNTANDQALNVVVQHGTANSSIAYVAKSTVVEPY